MSVTGSHHATPVHDDALDHEVADEQLRSAQLTSLDIQHEHLTPLSTEIMSRQATINVWIVGHHKHGKTALKTAISNTENRNNRRQFSASGREVKMVKNLGNLLKLLIEVALI